MNKKNFFNDPIYGFVEIQSPLVSELIEHPFFQRLRRIKQVGLTHLVYPGALHTRFQHAIGAMHLMGEAVKTICSKGHAITPEEAESADIAILLHDIGHGPFSHALENSIVENIHHEKISLLFMNELNEIFGNRLATAIKIFRNEYTKKFLHQLVSSQLDMDRLDYLNRDSFYAGVPEGVINSERIIKMLDVVNDELVIEAKGIYSIEKFIIARRLMYWQVYLHKTALAAEYLLVNILKRAKELSKQGENLFATPALSVFLKNNYNELDFLNNPVLLNTFAELDDYDIFSSVKVWTTCRDKVLSILCSNMVKRHLYKTEIQKDPFEKERILDLENKAASYFNVSREEVKYLVFSNSVINNAYSITAERINILYKDGSVRDIAEASDQSNIFALSQPVQKYFLCYPKEIDSVSSCSKGKQV